MLTKSHCKTKNLQFWTVPVTLVFADIFELDKSKFGKVSPRLSLTSELIITLGTAENCSRNSFEKVESQA